MRSSVTAGVTPLLARRANARGAVARKLHTRWGGCDSATGILLLTTFGPCSRSASPKAPRGLMRPQAANLAEALSEALAGSGHDTRTPAVVLGTIDKTLREMHQIRARAVGESRRRLDAAMTRSEQLLQDPGKRRGPVR